MHVADFFFLSMSGREISVEFQLISNQSQTSKTNWKFSILKEKLN
jgi:hypothetical protein